MALRKGDTITVRRQAVIWMTKYDSIKPSVSLTRTMGDDPEADRAEMDDILYVELRCAVLVEIEDRSGLDEAYERSVTTLIKHCEQVIAHGPQGRSANEDEDFPRRKKKIRAKKGVKKGGKKVARKARRRSG